MTVFVMDTPSEKLRGLLTRWLLEAKPGVLVGNISALVREKLWQKVCSDSRVSGALLIYSSNTEQGFQIDFYGEPRRTLIDFDGIQLIKVKNF